jgi:pyruvate formate lyase activating enzyme
VIERLFLDRIHVHGDRASVDEAAEFAAHVDPIEKKPFYHFLPGSAAYSLATSGCPLRCKFCQNWEISQAAPEDYRQEPVAAAAVARDAARHNAPVIAFTYNEPTVFMEYLCDIARAARDLGRRSVLVSCGYMNEAPLAELCEVLDAIKIDLKGMNPEFYRNVCGAELQPVLRSIRQVARHGRHLEIVNLVVPTLNDSEAGLRELVKWIAGEAGPDVPVHFTRFHPDYQLPNLAPTPVETLERARDLAREAGLRYAYVGNVPGHPGNHTYCPQCDNVVIERDGFLVSALRLVNGRCEYCGHPIPGVWT